MTDDKYKRLAKQLFGETDEKRKELLTALRDAIAKEELTVPESDQFHLKLLRAGGMDVEGAVAVLKNFLQQLNEWPHYFHKAFPPAKAEPVFKEKIHTVLKHRDRLGRRVYIYRPGRWNPDKMTFGDVYGATYMLAELMALEAKTQVCTICTLCSSL